MPLTFNPILQEVLTSQIPTGLGTRKHSVDLYWISPALTLSPLHWIRLCTYFSYDHIFTPRLSV